MLAAALILTIMILPIVTSISRDIMKSIPDAQREAAYALGATKWEVVKSSSNRSKIRNIRSYALLGLGRAVGETMAVTMVIGNQPRYFMFTYLIPAIRWQVLLANEFTEATSNFILVLLIEIALLLFVLTVILKFNCKINCLECD